MKLSPDNPRVETVTVTVTRAYEASRRVAMLAAGWKVQARCEQTDGTVKLTFARLKVGSREREA